MNRKRLYKIYQETLCSCNYCKINIIEMIETNNYPMLSHLIPLSRGGKKDDSNLVLVCTRCGRSKGNLTEKEFVDKKLSEQELEYSLFLELKNKYNKTNE